MSISHGGDEGGVRIRDGDEEPMESDVWDGSGEAAIRRMSRVPAGGREGWEKKMGVAARLFVGSRVAIQCWMEGI